MVTLSPGYARGLGLVALALPTPAAASLYAGRALEIAEGVMAIHGWMLPAMTFALVFIFVLGTGWAIIRFGTRRKRKRVSRRRTDAAVTRLDRRVGAAKKARPKAGAPSMHDMIG